ncbi:hypothetical protein [Acidianus sp. HS-5]|uniref:hypothetical protein n=1 Tax=Acidianus sp. HS-5 TaxID=2886040 RepID=UPI001F48E45D|nr:hypothetical protein [Acidianus sp. HS-5]
MLVLIRRDPNRLGCYILLQNVIVRLSVLSQRKRIWENEVMPSGYRATVLPFIYN